MRPTSPPRRSRLADGREILYFDDSPGRRGEPTPDARELPVRDAPSELRHDPLVDELVIIATHRQERTYLPSASDCPLCPSRGTTHTEVPDSGYDVVVFENRFPSLPATAPAETLAGRCEVVCYDSDHAGSFASLSAARLRTVGEAWAQRTAELSRDPRVAHVFVFENRGAEIGVTLDHPHGQVYAYPFLPPTIERMLSAARAHHATHASCLACDLLADEVADGRRIVAETEHAIAYVPLAARWPFEVHAVPRRHVPDLAGLADAERDGVVALEADILARLDGLFGDRTPYMAGWLQAPTGDGRDLFHLRLQMISPQRARGRLKHLAGSETIAGAFINDVRPEDAAERLRQANGRDR